MDRLACVDLRREVDEAGRADVTAMLRTFSPHIEPKQDEALFWLDGRGVDALFGSAEKWGGRIWECLCRAGFSPALAVGFTRFGVAAIVRARPGMTYLSSPQAERAMVMATSLRHLGLPPRMVRDLFRLGKRTVADLLSLPPEGLLTRFGAPVRELIALASGERWDPLVPLPETLPIAAALTLDHPETNATRLSFLVKRLLRSVLSQLRRRHLLLARLEMVLEVDHAAALCSVIEPAAPTLDEVQLADLSRLRLEALRLDAGVVGIELTAQGIIATAEQLVLFKKKSRRDSAAAMRALARIRAEFGTDSVMAATLREGHLPEARFALVPLKQLGRSVSRASPPEDTAPDVPARGFGGLVRRIYRRPVPLQTRPVVGPRGAHLLGMSEAPATLISGPYVVSGGWWTGEVHREYYFTETETGEILWVYFDKRRRRWFIHGVVD